MELTINVDNRFDIKLCDEDIINPDEIDYGDTKGQGRNSLFILHDHGHVVCAFWSSCLSDALDEAVDADMLDHYLIEESDYAEYGIGTNAPTCSFLGNAGEPFDIDTLGYVELSAPVRSNCAELGASTPKVLNWHVA